MKINIIASEIFYYDVDKNSTYLSDQIDLDQKTYSKYKKIMKDFYKMQDEIEKMIENNKSDNIPF